MSIPRSPKADDSIDPNSRYSSLPVKDVLRIRMKDLDIKNVDLQKALGYDRPNVIAMMKSGSMRLPANKVATSAQLLKIDPVFLLGKVISENDPVLWTVISALLGSQLVTANELALISLVRSRLDGHDVNLAERPDFTKLVEPLLNAIALRETALARAARDRGEDDSCSEPA